ncbi:SUMF1/EgtB/PvdO family nonheme iron enzyme [Streptomyces sp. NRRL WC-3742]|uniref:SUMF1/EgtB/PvdO family nonheme iron enzyme n=1 Tax=Streptomyces sp. NRRL WC-3742 TaxID=1463934 RepID=UPI002D21C3C5|nr:SUMF1/EgtB/PvdO family nonheme iron enzyme [Streptomyces sp. NRRL WC-3742]
MGWRAALATVEVWTGVEVKALRQAKRMSIEAFAAHLGISDRMVSKWESRGADITPRPVNQAALDTSLAASGPEAHERFVRLTGSSDAVLSDQHAETEHALPRQHQITHPGDGKRMALVEAGVFLAGPEKRPIWLPDFYIDVFPVTNSDFSRFVAATGHPAPRHWPKGKCPDSLFDHPVVFVTWHDAAAYVLWAGKLLPTSQQWEKAARGPRGDAYPWGDQLTPAKCNSRESGIGRTTPVSRFHSGVSAYGVYDLCGNTWEWCSDESEPGRRELKAGAFTSPFARATPSAFNDADTTMFDDDTGFRCCFVEAEPT